MIAWLIPLLGGLFAACLVYVLFGLFEQRRRRAEARKVTDRLKHLSFDSFMEEEGAVQILREEQLSDVPLVRVLLQAMPRVENLRALMEQGGVHMKVGSFYLLSLGLAAAGCLAALVFGLPLLFPVVLAAGGAVLPYLWLLRCKKKRIEAFEAQFAEAIDLLARAIRAGHAFSTGFQLIGEEMPDPVGEEFRRCFEEQKFGLPLKESLLNLMERIDLVDLRIFVTAVLIQREVGGNLAEILDKISYTIRERFKILRQVRVYTAQGRLTGYLLSALPILLGLVILTMNRDYMMILFERPIGRVMVTGAAIMQITGFFIIRKIIRIKV